MSFEIITLGDILTFSNGKTSPDRVNEGQYEVYGANGTIGSTDSINAPRNTIVIGRVGSYCGAVHFSKKECWVTDNAIKANAKNNTNSYYAYHLLSYLDLNRYRAGSGQPLINQSILNSLKVPNIDVFQQNKIAYILENIDKRIDLLKETNQTLESIAQAIFNSWFINFDPVHAKQQRIKCAGIDKTTADLFPDSFVESELGLIPNGWVVTDIKGICDVITNGGTPSRSNILYWENGTIPWYKTGELTDSFLINHSENITELGLEKSSVKLMDKESVVMAIYAAPTVGRLGILTQASTFNQATTGMKAKQEVGFVFLYLTLFFGRSWFNNRANGAAQQNISKGIVESYKLVLPTEDILDCFNANLMPVFKKIEQNINQIHTLSKLRDTLLPRLISGKLDLSEIEEQLDGVV
jgi:type I restriction enzyme S subunit